MPDIDSEKTRAALCDGQEADLSGLSRRDRAVQIATGCNGYERLFEMVGAENVAEFHACICGIAYAIADRIDAGSEFDHFPQREALRRIAEEADQ